MGFEVPLENSILTFELIGGQTLDYLGDIQERDEAKLGTKISERAGRICDIPLLQPPSALQTRPPQLFSTTQTS